MLIQKGTTVPICYNFNKKRYVECVQENNVYLILQVKYWFDFFFLLILGSEYEPSTEIMSNY